MTHLQLSGCDNFLAFSLPPSDHPRPAGEQQTFHERLVPAFVCIVRRGFYTQFVMARYQRVPDHYRLFCRET